MAVKKMNIEQFLEFLKKQQGEQTAQQFATRLGVSPQYLSDVYNGRRPPGESITAALKVEKAMVYTLVTPSGTSPSRGEKKAEEEK
ncbi:MAG: helix-turn-helix domain-containing protein [Terracidiphilus sp.]|jgi:transcriptional regulator with XRE-family HTH domain